MGRKLQQFNNKSAQVNSESKKYKLRVKQNNKVKMLNNTKPKDQKHVFFLECEEGDSWVMATESILKNLTRMVLIRGCSC